MRGLNIGLSCLLVAATIAVVVAEETDGVMKCQCSCDCPDGSSGCACDCDCPERGSTCAPGFTQVCPLTDGVCPAGMSEKCPGGGGGGAVATTTTTTPAPPEIVSETVSVAGKVKCGKVSYTCTMAVTYMNDCTSVTSVKPTCSPKKKACSKKPVVTMTTSDGCTVTGKFSGTSKGKQSMSALTIAGGGSVTTAAPGGTTAVAGGADMQGCQCVPDFLIFWQKAVPNDQEFPCACLPDEVMA